MTQVMLRYLDHYRETAIEKVLGLPDPTTRSSMLPSGWTPVELLRHLTYMEQRWFVWGFLGEDVGDPWADNRDGRWYVDDNESVTAVVERLRAQGVRTTAVLQGHDLAEVGQPGERWSGAAPATLDRIVLHVFQEYARHVGHLDIVRELADGASGE